MPGRPAPAGEEPYEAALGCGVPLPPTLGDAQGHQDEQPGVWNTEAAFSSRNIWMGDATGHLDYQPILAMCDSSGEAG